MKQVAEECNRLEILNMFISDPQSLKKEPLNHHKTMVVTDERMLGHAPFENYRNCEKRMKQKKEQPENAERLMVLTDPKMGVLTASTQFISNPRYKLVMEVQKVEISDVLKVHDYNYLRDIIE